MINLVFEKTDWNTIRVSRPRQGWSKPYPFVYIHTYLCGIDIHRMKTIGNRTTGRIQSFKNWDDLLEQHPCLGGVKKCG